MKYADLHIHTKFSDGTVAPEGIVEEARENGLSCIAITDHDTVLAIEPAMREAEKLNIEVVPAVELSSEIGDSVHSAYGCDIHILGYFIDWQAQWFKEKLQEICDVRQRRALAIIEKLRGLGINLDADELMSQAAVGSVGRLHIARLLQKQGFVYSIAEAFNKYIGNGHPCYVKKFKLTPAEAINIIHRLRGVAVLAHPQHIGKDELIPELVQSGLRGIEVYCPEYGGAASKHYQNLAKKYGLLLTGGSDYHGPDKNRLSLGKIRIPYNLVEELKKEAQSLRNE